MAAAASLFSLPHLSDWATWTPAVISAALLLPLSISVYFFFTAATRTNFPHIQGPKRDSFDGNLKELRQKGFLTCHKEWMQKFGRVFTYSFGSMEYLCISDPELVSELMMKKFKSFQDRPLPPLIQKENLKALAFAQGSYWASARRAVVPIFHSDKLRNYGSVMHRCSQTMKDRLREAAGKGEAVNVAPLIQEMAIDIIGEAAFGIEFNVQQGQQGELASVLTQYALGSSKIRFSVLVSMYCGRFMGTVAETVMKRLPWSEDAGVGRKMGVLMRETGKLARERREEGEGAEKRNDLLTLLARARTKDSAERELANDEVAAICAEFMLAGSDTSASTTTFATYFMCTHPHVREKMVAEIDAYFEELGGEEERGKPTFDELDQFPYLEQVVRETLRFYPTAATLSRKPKERSVLGAINVPAGQTMTVSIFAMHHNPEIFPEPESFRPERFDPDSEEARARHPYAYIPFGGGPRMCVGNKFALEEARIALIVMFRNFTFTLDETRMPSDHTDLEIEAGIVLKPKKGVWVKVALRK